MGVFKSWLKRTQNIDISPGKVRTWDPQYPDAARTPNEGSDNEGMIGDDPREKSGEGWVDAPATSHIESMHLASGAKGGAFDTPRQGVSSSFVRKFLNNESQITVRFKPNPKTGRGAAEYVYLFSDHQLALSIWEDLITSPHPYGEVLYPRVIKARIPYRPIWRD